MDQQVDDRGPEKTASEQMRRSWHPPQFYRMDVGTTGGVSGIGHDNPGADHNKS